MFVTCVRVEQNGTDPWAPAGCKRGTMRASHEAPAIPGQAGGLSAAVRRILHTRVQQTAQLNARRILAAAASADIRNLIPRASNQPESPVDSGSWQPIDWHARCSTTQSRLRRSNDGIGTRRTSSQGRCHAASQASFHVRIACFGPRPSGSGAGPGLHHPHGLPAGHDLPGIARKTNRSCARLPARRRVSDADPGPPGRGVQLLSAGSLPGGCRVRSGHALPHPDHLDL
jgi:hypothetical protein